MKKHLSLGITDTSYGGYPYGKALEKIASQGYEYIDFQGFVNTETEFFKSDTPTFGRIIAEKRAFIEARGLKIHQAHAPWRWRPNDSEAEARRIRTEEMKKAIYGTHLLGAGIFVVHPMMPYDETAENPDEVLAVNAAFYTELCDYASRLGVTVCVENMPWLTFPLSSVEASIRLCELVGRDNMGICLDTGHAAIFFGSDVASAVRLAGGRIKALHIHDNNGKCDEHLAIGDGIIDWDAFADSLREIGYDGVVSVETGPKHNLYPEHEWHKREETLAEKAREIADKI